MRIKVAIVAFALAALPLAADDLETAVSRMSRVGFSRSPSFSPDGRTVAFVSNLSGLPQVWTVPAAGGFPRMVTSFDDPVGGVEWSPDGSWIAFSLAPGGGMNAQVYLVKPDGTGLRRLTDGGKETGHPRRVRPLPGRGPRLPETSEPHSRECRARAVVHEVARGATLRARPT